MDCVRLTEDHKPSREDERQWIEKRGGIVIEINGTWRVFTPEIVVVGDKVARLKQLSVQRLSLFITGASMGTGRFPLAG